MRRWSVIVVMVVAAAPSAISHAREGGKRTPQDEALLGPLEKDAAFQPIPCFSRSLTQDEKYAAAVEASNQTKRAVHEAMASKQGIVKVKKTCPTADGAPVTQYLIVDRVKTTWVQDSTRDPHGGGADAYPVAEAELGYFTSVGDEREWHATHEPPPGTPLVLRFMFERESGPSMGEF
jgi:hypothetical protein